MKNHPIKFFSSILCFIIIFQILLLPYQSIEADAARWSSEQIPADGQLGKWVLALGSDLQHLSIAPDGSLYCYATPTGTTDTLFKSIDNGVSWFTTGRVKDVITDITVCPQDSNTIYYATASKVCKSTDAGVTFTALPLNPGGSGTGNVQITSIDIVRTSTGNIVALSTRDTDAGQFGGVYVLDESLSPLTWVDTAIGNYDVLCVAFSPAYANDKTLIAVTSNEVNTVISGKIEGTAWRATISDATIAGVLPISAVVSFPKDYVTTNTYFIGVNTGVNNGDVFRIDRSTLPTSSTALNLNAGLVDSLSSIDINSLCITGNSAGGTIIAGCAASAKTYLSSDAGITWTGNQKPPSGQTQTCVVVGTNILMQQMAFAVTMGIESAFSVSLDGGITWNQTALIDSKISAIVDIAVTSVVSSYPGFFMITFNNSNLKHSIWRRFNATSPWQRIFNGNLPSVTAINNVICSPGNNSRTLYLAGERDGSPAIWQSNDSGQTFVVRSAPCSITSIILADDRTLYVGGFTSGKGMIYYSGDGGVTFPDTAEAGTRSIISLSLSPSFVQDKTIIAGNNNGQVFWSNNRGVSFEQVGQQLPVAAGIGKVSLAFDRDYNVNKTIYAATDAKVTTASKERIFRFVIG